MVYLSRSYHFKFFKGCLPQISLSISIREYFVQFKQTYMFLLHFLVDLLLFLNDNVEEESE